MKEAMVVTNKNLLNAAVQLITSCKRSIKDISSAETAYKKLEDQQLKREQAVANPKAKARPAVIGRGSARNVLARIEGPAIFNWQFDVAFTMTEYKDLEELQTSMKTDAVDMAVPFVVPALLYMYIITNKNYVQTIQFFLIYIYIYNVIHI